MAQAWDKKKKKKSESPTGIKPMTSTRGNLLMTPAGTLSTELREQMESVRQKKIRVPNGNQTHDLPNTGGHSIHLAT